LVKTDLQSLNGKIVVITSEKINIELLSMARCWSTILT